MVALLHSHRSKATMLRSPGPPTSGQSPAPALGPALAGVAVVVALAALVRFLEQTVPAATKGTAFGDVAAAIEFPVYAIALGLLGNLVLTLPAVARPAGAAFRTEFFIKTGLVLLGVSINLALIVSAAGPAIAAGPDADQRRVRLHLVDRRQARTRRQAAGAARVGRVDLWRQRGDRRRRRGEGQARTAGLHGEPGDRLRAAVDLPAARAGRPARPLARRWPAPGSAATSTPRRP